MPKLILLRIGRQQGIEACMKKVANATVSPMTRAKLHRRYTGSSGARPVRLVSRKDQSHSKQSGKDDKRPGIEVQAKDRRTIAEIRRNNVQQDLPDRGRRTNECC